MKKHIFDIFFTLGPKRRRNRSVRPITFVFVYYNLSKKHGFQKSPGGVEHENIGKKDAITIFINFCTMLHYK